MPPMLGHFHVIHSCPSLSSAVRRIGMRILCNGQHRYIHGNITSLAVRDVISYVTFSDTVSSAKQGNIRDAYCFIDSNMALPEVRDILVLHRIRVGSRVQKRTAIDILRPIDRYKRTTSPVLECTVRCCKYVCEQNLGSKSW